MSPMRRLSLWVSWFVLLAAVLNGQSSWVVEPTGTTANLWGVAGNDGQVIAVGEQGTILARTAAGTWERRNSGTTAWLTSVTWVQTLAKFFACGEGGIVLSSPDGVFWTREAAPAGPRLNAIRGDTGYATVAAIGETGAGVVVRSYDGAWTRAAADFGTGWMRGFDGHFAAGRDGTVFQRDGDSMLAWKPVATPLRFEIEALADAPQFAQVGETRFAVGAGGMLLQRMPDGWVVRTTGTSARLRGIAAKISGYARFLAMTMGIPVGEYFVVGERGTILRSVDGATWAGDPAPIDRSLNHVASVRDDVFVVGDTGTILSLRRASAPVIEEEPRILPLAGSAHVQVRASGPGSIGFLWVYDGGGFPTPIWDAQAPTMPLPQEGVVYRAYVYNAHGLTVSEGVTRHRFRNLSTLATVGKAEGGLVAGFIVQGPPSVFPIRRVLVRAIGPGLAAFGVAQPLPSPRLLVYANDQAIAYNEGWMTSARPAELSAAAQAVGAFPLQPGSADSAVLLELSERSYTVHLDGNEAHTGSTLLEIYDATQPTLRRLINLSARARVAPGGPALTAGFIVEGAYPKRVLIRGVGPGLAAFHVRDPLARPQLVLRRSGAVIAAAVAWHTQPNAGEIRAAIESVKAFPLSDDALDSAMLVELAAGAYTVELTGVDGGGGMALIEAYEL